MLIDQDDLEYIKTADPDFRSYGLVRFEFSDIPAGLLRYILCSKNVDDEIISKINNALTKSSSPKMR